MKEIAYGSRFISGYAFKSKEFSENGIPIVKIKNIQNDKVDFSQSQYFPNNKFSSKLEKYVLKNKDVLIAMTGRGSVGRVGQLRILPNEFGLLNQRVGKFVCDEITLNRDFLFHVLTNKRYQEHLFFKAVGSGQPNLSPDDILSTEIPLPKYSEQKAIASILAVIDDKIELNLQMNKILEEMAMTLYKHWFVDFGPFKDGKFVESELGMIPEGWEVKSIKQFGKIVCGKTPSKKVQDNYTSSNGYNLIKIPDMHNKLFVIKSSDLLSEKGHSSQEKKLIPSNSINVSCIATVGLVTINAVDSHTNQQINSIIPEKEEYLYYLVNTMKNLKTRFLQEASGGSATLNMNTSTFSNIEIIKPEYKALKNYHSIVSDIYNLLKENTYNNESLISLRNTLLPKLISGKVRLKEFDKQVSEAL